MECSVSPPTCGEGALALEPKEFTKKFFEFFPVGRRFEVLLLGELLDQPMHYVRSKGHKVLCGSRVGVCNLCQIAGESDDVETRQLEYSVPAFVREWSSRVFEQKVAVLSAATRVKVVSLMGQEAMRGRRLEIVAKKQGTSTRYHVVSLPGLPRNFPAVIPPKFDVTPFFRGRFGKSQEPGRMPEFLPSFKCEPTPGIGAGVSKGLALSAADCAPTTDELAEMKELLEKRGFATGAAKPKPAPVPPAQAIDAELDEAEEMLGARPGSLAAHERVSDPRNYGPKVRVAGGVLPVTPRGKVEQAPLSSTIDEVPVLAAIRNGHAVPNGKGGAK